MTLKEMVEAVESGRVVYTKELGAKVYKELGIIESPYIYENKHGVKEPAIAIWEQHDKFEIFKEPKWRPFKTREMPEEYKDYWFKEKSLGILRRPEAYDYRGDLQIKIKCEWMSNTNLFDDYEVQINGKWLPVGVKNESN